MRCKKFAKNKNDFYKRLLLSIRKFGILNFVPDRPAGESVDARELHDFGGKRLCSIN